MRGRKIKKRGRGIGKLVLGLLLLIIGAATVAACAIFRFDEWHTLDAGLLTECDRSLLIYDGSGELICAAGGVKRIPIEIDTLSDNTLNAFIAAEDTRFYSHNGVDIYRIFGAAWADIKAGGYVQGASTISQQLIKLSHLSSEKTIERKLEEAVLATELEARFDKREILEMYLNYVYFGGGYYGIEAASLGYFGKHASELTTAQAAQLAGILKSPSAYAPHLDAEASLTRRDAVLRLMREYGYIDDKELSFALKEKFALVNAFPSARSCLIDYAADEACGLLGMEKEELLRSGYSVYTTIDSGLEAHCAELMEDDGCFPSDNAQGALAVLGTDGSILCMQGCRGEYAPGSLNRAAEIERQPGSLIKPILVYAPALEEYGYTSATLLRDEPTSFGDYTPRNSDGKYYGTVTLHSAVTRSLNVPAVSVLADIGLPSAVMFAQRLGVSFEGEELGLALALGGFTHGVSPLEMAGAYASIADGGVYISPTSIEKIVDPNGAIVYERSFSGERVMRRENAYILTTMLQSAASEGTGRRLAETGLPLAAKTGTSVDDNGVRDAWCAAYSDEYAAVVWMGADDATQGSLPSTAVGGNQPAILLGKVFGFLYSGRTFDGFEAPQNVSAYDVDIYSAESEGVYLAGELTPEEYRESDCFISGTEPEAESGLWDPPQPPDELGWSMDADGRPVISFTAESGRLIYRVYRKSEEGGVLLAEFTGRTGYVSFADDTAEPGAMYRYCVTAVHPEIKQNGVPLESAPSRELVIVIPFAQAA